MTDGRTKGGCNANPVVFSSHLKIRSHQVIKLYMKVSGEPVQTGICQCITTGKLCYRYSLFTFQRNALEGGLLKKKMLGFVSQCI